MANKEHRMKQSLGLRSLWSGTGYQLRRYHGEIRFYHAARPRKTNGSGWMVIKLPVMWPPCRRPSPPVRNCRTAERHGGPQGYRPGRRRDPARETPPPSVIEPEPEESEIADVVSSASRRGPRIRTGQLQPVSGSKNVSSPEGRTSHALHSSR